MKKLLPLVLLLVGAGAGVGAGVFLRPDATTHIADLDGAELPEEENGSEQKENAYNDENAEKAQDAAVGESNGNSEYVKLQNQFVVPLVAGDKVIALVVMALSVEVHEGKRELVLQREPKLRDSILQVLFDHANVGGFEGNFTDAQVMGRLRASLNEVAQRDLGKDNALGVLIEEIARQDY